MRTSILVLAGLLTAGSARADSVGIVVTGEATLQPLLTSQLHRWLHDRGHTVVPGALEPEAINTLVDCFVLEDLACARDVVGARSKSRSLVYARVEQTPNEDGTRDVSVTGHYFEKDHDARFERRVCSACTDEKLVGTVDELMHALVHEPAPPVAEKPVEAPVTEQPETKRSLLPYGLAGAGALALVGGIVMIAIDEDPDPMGVQRPTYRDTALAGTVLAGAGAAALGVGLYLWFSETPSSQPVAAISRDGAVVGWAGRF